MVCESRFTPEQTRKILGGGIPMVIMEKDKAEARLSAAKKIFSRGSLSI